MLKSAYGILEELGAEIGYTATASLVDWFGGGNLWVPQEANEAHPISRVIGMPAMRALVRFVDRRAVNKAVDRLVSLPSGYQREIDRRDRMIAALSACGKDVDQIAEISRMSKRHVYVVLERLREIGMLEIITERHAPPPESVVKKPGLKK